MKIALLLSGFVRNFDFDNFEKNLLSEDVDVFAHISDDEEKSDRYISSSSTIEKLKPKLVIKEKEIEEKSNLFRQWYKVNSIFSRFVEWSDENQISYDVIVRCRYDILFFDKIKFLIDDKLHIPREHLIDRNKLSSPSDECICDIFCFGGMEVMKKYFNFFHHLSEMIKRHNSVISENLLFHYLKDEKVEYFDLPFKILLSKVNTIAICGDSGVGKSELSKIITKIFKNSTILECDRYHKWDRYSEEWKKYTHLNPDANYLFKMRQDVFDLKIGNDVYQVDYDHSTGKFTEKEIIETNENIIVCGLHTIFEEESRKIMNLKIFLEVEDELRVKWKIKRDFSERGYSFSEIMKKIKEREDDYKKYILPQRDFADIIIKFYDGEEITFEILLNDKVDEKIKDKFSFLGEKIIFDEEIYSNIVENLLRAFF